MITDNNLFFSSTEEKRGYKFTQRRDEIDLRKENLNFPGSFSQMNFMFNTNTEIYFRRYTKLFEVIADIGGFSNGIIFIAYMVLYIYSKNIILWNCIEVLISKDEIKENLGIIDSNKNKEIINTLNFNISNLNERRLNINNAKNDLRPSQLNLNDNNDNNNLR